MIKFSWRGATEIKAKLGRMSVDLPKMIATAVYQETLIESTECKKRTPVANGNLKSSIHVEGPDISGRKMSATIVAGGPSAPYALYVHENLDAFHKVGEAKFIEGPLLESRPYMAGRVAKRLNTMLKDFK